MELEKLRQELRDFLNKNDLRLEQASNRSGVSVGSLSKFLNGKSNPNARTEYKIRKLIEGK